MDMHELAFLPIADVARLLARKQVSPVELLEAVLAQIERHNPRLNAYLTVSIEQARRDARRAEKEILRKRYRGPLHGVPISLKDNIYTRGVKTTAGSKVLAGFVPSEDATLVEGLRRAGAILVGKTNLHEFAYGVTTNNPHFGPARNPWDTQRIPGGSSGGSAAAIVTGMCFGSIGSDTGGSIRIPAAMCGIVGLKPTYGRVSCHGVVPLSKSLDHAGPLGRTVTDVALLLQAIAGHDARDAATVNVPVPDYAKGLQAPLRKLRLGWPREYFFERLDPEVKRTVQQAGKMFERLGAKVEEVSLPHLDDSVEPSTHIAFAEALAHHQEAGWYPARAADYSEELRRRLEAGKDVRATDYLRAFEVQKIVRADFARAFQRVDAILAPSVPVPAPRIGQEGVILGGREETVRAALLRLNQPANFTGLPAISLPCGFTRAGLPVGLQLLGRAFDEAGLLRVARAFEKSTDWSCKRPTGI